MARFSTTVPTFTPTATADTTNLADNTHHTIQGGSATQRLEMRDIILTGQATASAVAMTVFGRTSTVGATLTAARQAAIDPATAALAAVSDSTVDSTCVNRTPRAAAL